MLRETVIASLFLGAIVFVIGATLGHAAVGVGLAAGLAIGCSNGYLMVATINRRAPFVAASIFRLALLSSTAVMVAILLHGSPWAVVLGVGVAQMVMAAFALREGLRS
jgi:hypothetical protein